MALRLGSTAISGAYVGSDPVARIYLGSDLIWAATPSITGNGSGTVDINVDDGTFSVTVSGSDYAHQNGTFGPFDTADLDSGPVLVVAPVISGSAVEDSTLTAEPGLWVYDTADGTTTVTAIWQADGVDISGETGTTYVTVGGDVGAEITYRETATNDAGTRVSDSNGIIISAAATAPAQMAAPTFSGVSYETATVIRGTAPADGGSAITGYRMQYRPTSGGAWTEVDPFGATEDLTGLDNGTEYEAQQRAVNVVGAGDWSASGTFATDQLPDILGNVGGTVDVNVSEDETTCSVIVAGSFYAHQNGTHGPFTLTDFDLGPLNAVAPPISGSAVEGSTLTALPGLWLFDIADGTTTITGQWRADGVAISGATGTTYVTQPGDVGAEITYRETATNDAGTRVSDSNGITVTASGAWSTEVVENFIRINSMVNVTAPTSEVVGNKIRITA